MYIYHVYIEYEFIKKYRLSGSRLG
jgi:hypothetical protein